MQKAACSKRGIFLIDPYPPSNLTEVDKSSNTIRLSWTSPSGVFSGFDLYTYHGNSETVKRLANVATHLVTDLEPHTRYRFALRTVSGSGEDETFSSLTPEVNKFTREYCFWFLRHVVDLICIAKMVCRHAKSQICRSAF